MSFTNVNQERWHKANPEKLKTTINKWRNKNRKRLSDYTKQWKKKNPKLLKNQLKRYKLKHFDKWKEKQRNHNRKRLLLKACIIMAFGSHTENQWNDLKRLFKFRCAICNKRKKLTRDHIIPLIKGGSDLIENIQPLCFMCNSKKGSK